MDANLLNFISNYDRKVEEDNKIFSHLENNTNNFKQSFLLKYSIVEKDWNNLIKDDGILYELYNNELKQEELENKFLNKFNKEIEVTEFYQIKGKNKSYLILNILYPEDINVEDLYKFTKTAINELLIQEKKDVNFYVLRPENSLIYPNKTISIILVKE